MTYIALSMTLASEPKTTNVISSPGQERNVVEENMAQAQRKLILGERENAADLWRRRRDWSWRRKVGHH